MEGGGNCLIANALMNASIIGVNCFVLISGYYLIKLSLKSIVSLYLTCAFYSVIFALYALFNNRIGMLDFLKSFFAFSETGLWFIKSYVGLMLVSPLINRAIQNITKKDFTIIIVLLSVLNVYFGYMHQIDELNMSGYNLTHLIYIYLIGAYIKQCVKLNQEWRYPYLFVWIFTVVIMTILYVIKIKCQFPFVAVFYSLRYNSPAVLLASISFFLFIRTLSFKNSYINWCAASVLSIYLVHQNQYIGNLWKAMLDFISSVQSFYVIFSIIFFVFCWFVSCILIDKIRIYLCTPVSNFILNQLNRIQYSLKK